MPFTPTDPTQAEVRVTGAAPNQQLEFYIPRGPKGDPGGLTATSVPVGTDLDGFVTAGAYAVPAASDAAAAALAHMPMNEAGSLVVTLSNALSNQIQTYTTNTKGVYVRRRFSGTWSAWRHFASSRVDQTAGRAMYQWDELNGREQLVYGDTGWRQVIAPGDIANMPNMQGYLRRVGNQVTFQAYETTAGGTAAGATPLYVTPNGFRFVLGASPAMVAGQVIDSGAMPVPNATIYLASGGVYTVTLRAVSGVRHYCTISWLTTDAWPTALPGTAHGTIPAA